MLRCLALLMLLGSTAGQGQSVGRGPVRNANLHTTTDLVLYVDPTGSDSNPCTASGTAACLTIQGAFSKAPKRLFHRLTVNLAAGNYAGFTLSGFTVDPSVQKTTGGILLQGAALANVTPTTSTATGTASAGSAGSGTAFGTLTDATKAWTVNDPAIVGKLVAISSGTGSGQTRVIASNTATVLTIEGTWTVPDATSVFAIQSPSSIITSTTPLIPSPTGSANAVAAAVQMFDNTIGSGTGSSSAIVLVQDLGISVGSSAAFSISGPNNVFFSRMTVAAGQSTITGNPARVTFSSTGFVSTSAALSILGSKVVLTNSRLAAASSVVTVSSLSDLTVSSCSVFPAGVSNSGLGVGSNSQALISNLRCDCGGVATTHCISVSAGGSPSKSDFPGAVAMAAATGVDVANCAFGISVNPGTAAWTTNDGTFTGAVSTNAVRVFNGGSVTLPASSTITSGVAGMTIDNGVATGALSDLSATYSCLSSAATTSRVCRL